MNVIRRCMTCECELMSIDIEAQLIKRGCEYYTVRDIKDGETWDTCNPFNEYVSICVLCFSPRLDECRKRVIGSV